jgi:hypothetical protein
VLPARRPPTPSSEEDSGDETDLRGGGIDQLPDSSRSSRRPPILDSKVPSAEFRLAAWAGDRGFFLWIRIKEGHLFKVDVRTGNITASKHSVHGRCRSRCKAF